jgi:potassium channel subfamily K, other eukaryote
MPGVAQKSIVVGSKAVTIHADEVESAFRANIIALLLVLSYIAVAILYYHFIEGWRVVDCIYFAMVIVTTVGYGDVVPVKTAGKAFTIFFAFYGICTIGVALGRLASWFLSRQQTIAKETTQRLLNHVDNAADQTAAVKPGDEPDNVVAVKVGRKHKRSLKRPKWLEWLVSDSNKAIAMAILPILVSIGGGLVLGAIEGWPVLDCFYYAVITVTTVGFGDFSPQSEAGRIYAIFYLPLSVVSVAHGIGSVFEELGKRRVLKNKISMKELLAMDSDGDGKVSQLEYLSYMLVKLGKADQSDITGILAQFRKLDKDGSGELDKDDLVRLDRHLQREHDE